jgi:hypothetical protein
VEWLDRDHDGERPDIEQLKWIKAHYKKQAAELTKAKQASNGYF